jgi:hypothetical protein
MTAVISTAARREDRMSEMTQDRWGALSGFAALAVGAAAVVFERGAPPVGASDVEEAAFHGAHVQALLMQSLLFLISAALLLWFVGCLRTHLTAAEGGSGRYAGLVFGAGVGYVALSLTAQAGQIALAQVAGAAATPQLVAAVGSLTWALFTVAAVPAAVMLAAFAVLTARSPAMPGWLGWVAAAAGAAQLGLLAGVVVTTGPLAPGGWYTFAPYPLFVVWLAATAAVMLRRPAPADRSAVAAPTRERHRDEPSTSAYDRRRSMR